MRIIKNILFVFSLLLTNLFSFGQDIIAKPNPAKLVNDYTNTLTADQVQALEQKLYTFDDSTTTQITVVIIPTTNGQDIADYATELGRKWGVGGKENNNGVVLLIAKDDRKLNISPGYGLEEKLSDVTAKEIIDDIIVPNFKGNDYYHGIDQGTDAIIRAVQGQYKAPAGYGQKTISSAKSIGKIIFIIIIIIIALASRSGGGKGGGFMSRRGFSSGILPALFLGSGGGWGGGGSGGSSGGGGGFGGFGGGSFGGGGSSGSW